MVLRENGSWYRQSNSRMALNTLGKAVQLHTANSEGENREKAREKEIGGGAHTIAFSF